MSKNEKYAVVANGILDSLESEYSGDNKSQILVEKLKFISKKMGYKLTDLKRQLDRSENETRQLVIKRKNQVTTTSQKNENKSVKHGYFQWIFNLHFVFGFSLDELGVTTQSEARKLIFAANRKNIGEKSPTTEIVQLEGFTSLSDGSQEIRKKYIEPLKKFIKESNEWIKIYDYVERNSLYSSTELSGYWEAKKELYSELERKIKAKDFVYIRILAFPFECKISVEKRLDKATKKRILKHLSLELFTHIYNCLKLSTDFISKGPESGFYISGWLARNYTYAISDQQVNVSKYFRNDRKTKENLPSMLFVDNYSVEDQTEKMYQIYDREISALLEDKRKFDLCGASTILDELISECGVQLQNKNIEPALKMSLKYDLEILKKKKLIIGDKFLFLESNEDQ